jgi:hypothetical protein
MFDISDEKTATMEKLKIVRVKDDADRRLAIASEAAKLTLVYALHFNPG